MRLLVALAHTPWPPVGGGRLRSWQLSSRLARRHETHLFALCTPEEPGQAAAPPGLPYASVTIASLPPLNPPRFSPDWLMLRARSLRHPAAAFFRPDAAARFADLVRRVRPEVIVYGMSWMLPYARAAPGVPSVADEQNYDPLITARMAAGRGGLDALKWRLYVAVTAHAERRNLRAVRGISACSEEDAAIFRREAPHAEVVVVPNAVDAAAFAVTPPGDAVVMTGSFAYSPNREGAERMARRIWPLVRAAVPSAALRFVGLRGEEVLRGLAGLPGVTVVGTVPEIQPELARARVAVAPLDVGGGTRLKILEAMAAARPVVSTTIGAEGLAVRDGAQLFLRDDDAAFADAVIRLLREPALALTMGLRGRALVEAHYDWEASADALDALVRRVAA